MSLPSRLPSKNMGEFPEGDVGELLLELLLLDQTPLVVDVVAVGVVVLGVYVDCSPPTRYSSYQCNDKGNGEEQKQK